MTDSVALSEEGLERLDGLDDLQNLLEGAGSSTVTDGIGVEQETINTERDYDGGGGQDNEPDGVDIGSEMDFGEGLADHDEGAVSQADPSERGFDEELSQDPDVTSEYSVTPREQEETTTAAPDDDVQEDARYEHVVAAMLVKINQARDGHGLEPLEADTSLDAAAGAHARELCREGYLSHLSCDGAGPFQRYCAASGGAHVVEVVMGEAFATDMEVEADEEVFDHALTLLEGTLTDGDQLTSRDFTHIGISVCAVNSQLRCVIVIASKHVELSEIPSELSASGSSALVGQILQPNMGPLALLVFLEPSAAPLSPEVLRDRYPTSLRTTISTIAATAPACVVWPWEMVYDQGSASFRVPLASIANTELSPGCDLRLQLLLRADVASIPYDAPVEGLEIPGEGAVVATAVVITNTGSDEDGMGGGDGSTDGNKVPFILESDGDGWWPGPVAGHERQAQEVAAASVLRPQVFPIVGIEIRHSLGAVDLASQDYEQQLFMPINRIESASVLNASVQFRRLQHIENEDDPDPIEVLVDVITVSAEPGQDPVVPEGYELLTSDLTGVSIDAPPTAPSTEDKAAATSENDETLAQAQAQADEQSPPVEGSEEQAPQQDALEQVRQEAPKKPPITRVFLCYKTAPLQDGVSPLTDIAMVYSVTGGTGNHVPFEMGSGWETIALPDHVAFALDAEAIYLCLRRSDSSGDVGQLAVARTADRSVKQLQAELQAETGVTEMDGPPVGDTAPPAYTVDTTMDADQVREWEGKRAKDAADRAHTADMEVANRAHRETIQARRARIDALEAEREKLQRSNHEWQKHVAGLMALQQRRREETRGGGGADHGGAGGDKEATPQHESEKHYAEILTSVVEARERLSRQQAEYDRVAVDLQVRLDEKEYNAREIADYFKEFKREITRSAENSRTNKRIPRRLIAEFEAAEAARDEEIEKVRLKNINLRMTLRKHETWLRSKEQLAEGLHLIDFEQLKIENQTLGEKIEERNEELQKLRSKNTSTVQVLTQVKEKLQFVAAENAVVQRQLTELDAELSQGRDALSRAKQERDSLREENSVTKLRQGFNSSDLLVQDYETRRHELKKLQIRLEKMKEQHATLSRELRRGAEDAAGRSAQTVSR